VSPESFQWAGEHGYHLMIIPMVASHERLTELLDIYQQARKDRSQPRLHVSYHCYLARDRIEAKDRAEQHFADYQRKQLGAYAAWRGITSDQYPGYERMEAAARGTTFVDLLDADKVIIGDIDEVTRALLRADERYPGAEVSLHVRFGDISHEEAMRTVTLLGTEVLPGLTASRVVL
jgi:alkanesulfonate monooxygenase SsuD/methylene tetrahydromethanopterin reductase-like flavin-dependent oxidoreductase (luciferase family)